MEQTPEIRRVAVVGAGYMGHGIALEFALAGVPVALNDRTDALLARARDAIAADLATMAAAGVVAPDRIEPALARIAPHAGLATAVAAADLVVEAVPEDLPLKRAVFAALDAHCPPDAILASNTSTFLPSALAAATARPERVLVAHYFHPPHLLPLVELVPSRATAPEVLEAVRRLLERIGKRPVVLRREVPGFIGNRLQAALFREALALVEQGIADPDAVDAVVTSSFGRRLAVVGPFAAMDLAGLDVLLRVMDQLSPEISGSPETSSLLRDAVAADRLGVKAGAGFRPWPPEEAAAIRERLARALVAVAELSGPVGNIGQDGKEVRVEALTPDPSPAHRERGDDSGRALS